MTTRRFRSKPRIDNKKCTQTSESVGKECQGSFTHMDSRLKHPLMARNCVHLIQQLCTAVEKAQSRCS